MLRDIKGDIGAKQYTRRAREVAYYHDELKEEITRAISKKSPSLQSAIRSVTQTGNTIVIRAQSRAAMSELYMAREKIQEITRRTGSANVRFSL